MRERRRRLRGAAVEIGDGNFGFRRLGWCKLVADRSGQPVLAISVTTATAAAASTDPAKRTPLATVLIVATGKARLLLGIVLGFAFLALWLASWFSNGVFAVLTRLTGFAAFAAASSF